jgi:hypothetical protein
MLSDELDKKIKETAEGYHPAYDEKAWDKMEVLLDKHLPLEKKRRRFILLLLSLFLIGTGTFFILQKPGRNAVSEEKNTVIQPGSESKQPAQGADITTPSKKTIAKQATFPAQQDITTPVPGDNKPNGIKLQKQLAVSGDINSNNRKKVKRVISQEKQFEQQQSLKEKNHNHITKDQENNFAQQQRSEQNTLVTAAGKSIVNNNISPVSSDTSASVTQIAKATEEKKQPDSSGTKEAIAETKPQKQRNSAASKFSVNLSAGPDISSIGIDNPGKWTLQYGIGFSYALSKRLSVRTGFFAGRKKYSADSTEYHSAYYPPKLERIDANCLVYEIPVNLIYSFSAIKKHNWFVAGGLSSYLMKKETYDYFYKNAWGQPQFYSHTYKNKNSHIFSVINISGGYQYHFTDRLSLMAEPYVRISVSGIGSGKVKLNSGGILFSIGFKPFLKKK